MGARVIEWHREPFALLVESPEGDYLIPPIVLDENERPIEGHELFAGIVEAGIGVKLPVIRGASPADLAAIDQEVARLSDELGVPIGWAAHHSTGD